MKELHEKCVTTKISVELSLTVYRVELVQDFFVQAGHETT